MLLVPEHTGLHGYVVHDKSVADSRVWTAVDGVSTNLLFFR